jgi:hypothetical protein
MPNYDIKYKPTGEITERTLTIAALEELLKDPNYEVAFLTMNIGDPVVLGFHRPPSDFDNYVLAPIEKRYNDGKRRETRFGRKSQNV